MPPTPHARQSDPGPGRRLGVGRRLGIGALVGALLCGGLSPLQAEAGGATRPEPAFTRFTAAWQKRSTDAVVACMDPKGTVLFKLLSYPLAGKARSMKPEQAKASLKTYFKKLSGLKMKDVTPKKSPEKVRLYDYTYKPEGKNPRTTRLHVQLKQDKNSLWVLASLTESAKPRK